MSAAERLESRLIKGGVVMKTKLKWIVLGFLFLALAGLTFIRTPEAITGMLENVSAEARSYSAFVHLLFLAVAGAGLFMKKFRTTLFSLFIGYLSLSATVVSVMYLIWPNIILFGTLFVLIVHACLARQLHFDFRSPSGPDMLFGLSGLVFGFWYLHWVESPIWLNALLYSPLGVVNCPTLSVICGFIILSGTPRSAVLETAAAVATLYFGLFRIFRLGAYIGIVLILCGFYLLLRPARIA